MIPKLSPLLTPVLTAGQNASTCSPTPRPQGSRRTFANSRLSQVSHPQGEEGVGRGAVGASGVRGCVLPSPRGAKGGSVCAARLCSRAFVIHEPQTPRKAWGHVLLQETWSLTTWHVTARPRPPLRRPGNLCLHVGPLPTHFTRGVFSRWDFALESVFYMIDTN